VFNRHPDVRGSRLIGDGLVGSPHQYAICSSSERTRRFYNEQIARLFGAVPDLAGVFLIVGCEGIFHCFTGPWRRGNGHTDCPQCAKMDPEEEVVRGGQFAQRLEATLLHPPRPAGKLLDFLVQELARELQTLSQKIKEFAIREDVVRLKLLAERMREQIQNIE